ncbi:MAG: pirin-like C-terminal cupin domain-containing protein, partial [Brevundimonas sp.]|nr:pirin-like C-terminal cupin domain-containing protein [Brevundimonas sp.]
AWIALPEEAEETDPRFHHHGEADQPAYENGGLFARLVAGEAYGARAAAPVSSPLFYVHWELAEGVRTAPPPGKGAGGYSERALYVAKGEIEVGDRTFHEGQMIILEPTAEPTIRAIKASSVMVLGGEPVGPRIIWWNFVHSKQERIDQAKADWKAGRMTLPTEDDVEFIPLPDVPSTPEPAPAGVKPEPTHPV